VSVLSSMFIALGGRGVARAADTEDVASAVFYNCLVYTAYPGEQGSTQNRPTDGMSQQMKRPMTSRQTWTASSL
jgi:hypothetical protein